MRLFVNGLTNSKNQINIWLDIVLPINVALVQLINVAHGASKSKSVCCYNH
jgi:hypothetical protein